MNRRKLLQLICVAPLATAIPLKAKKEIVKEAIPKTITFTLTGTDLVGVLNRAGHKLDRFKHLS